MNEFLPVSSAIQPTNSFGIYVKQYGAMRTGTNALRVMLQEGFTGMEVLMHTLGDKHSEPSRLVVGQTVDWQRAALDLVWEATLEKPAATTAYQDIKQRDFIEQLANPLIAALRQDKVYYLVTIKSPYAWATSMLRMQGKLPPRGFGGVRKALSQEHLRGLRLLCQEYNKVYATWLRLAHERSPNWLVIRHEDLVTSPNMVMERLKIQFSMLTFNEKWLPPAGTVIPTHWDADTSYVRYHSFNAAYYTEQHYLQDLGKSAIQLVTEVIDWPLFSQYQYAPLSERV